MFGLIAKKIFGTRNERIIARMAPLVQRVNELEQKIQAMSDASLRNQTTLFRERIARGENLDQLQAEAFATVREAAKRALGMRHFDTQIIGGAVLHTGLISEMKTGEGKTLVATLAAYLNALSGRGVHIVTVNDYLARRDAEWMGNIYNFLGMSVGVVLPGMRELPKREAYLADITYGQNNEFGFDYLRDNMKFRAEDQMQRGHVFAIVDEVDSILIDEARTPLIISGPAEESTDKYLKINQIIPNLRRDSHFEIDLKSKQPSLTEAGVARCEELLGIDNLYDPSHIEALHHVQQALRAHTTLERDVDYVVKDGEVIIVDEFTGRLMAGRRWSNGLHQAVEAKENLKIARENQTLASITFQNYFRMYEKLSGMTGTADTEAVEFKTIYNLEVVVIPTNRPMVRADESDVVFRTRKEKYNAVVEDIAEINKTGQPVLVGTISIEQSEALSQQLKRKGVTHNVLNAKQHEREAEIVAQAGRFGAVTISTNMAGRGTDIVLGGNPDFLAAAEAGTKERSSPEFKQAHEHFIAECARERQQVIDAGGLFILGTERHESRRIDNQLRGRAGRQGDPGRSRFYISLEDDLMMRFGGERIQAIMSRLGWEEGVAIDGRLISRSIENAQKRVEAFHFEARKHVTDYDDVMNKQRQVIYNLRSRILANQGIQEEIGEMINDLLEDMIVNVCDEKVRPLEWKLDELCERFSFLFNTKYQLPSDIQLDRQVLFDRVREDAHRMFREREVEQTARLNAIESLARSQQQANGGSGGDVSTITFEDFERDVLLETLDHFWNLHLQEMDYLREGIGLRGYGQKNPLYEYQREGFIMFQHMLETLRENVIRKIFFSEVLDPNQIAQHLEAERLRREAAQKKMQMIHQNAANPEGVIEENDAVKSPDEQRARMEAQRRERRKMRR